jgi:hypothetical protein
VKIYYWMAVIVAAETRSAVEMMLDGFQLEGIDRSGHSNTGCRIPMR